jgi:hypothetical protein
MKHGGFTLQISYFHLFLTPVVDFPVKEIAIHGHGFVSSCLIHFSVFKMGHKWFSYYLRYWLPLQLGIEWAVIVHLVSVNPSTASHSMGFIPRHRLCCVDAPPGLRSLSGPLKTEAIYCAINSRSHKFRESLSLRVIPGQADSGSVRLFVVIDAIRTSSDTVETEWKVCDPHRILAVTR